MSVYYFPHAALQPLPKPTRNVGKKAPIPENEILLIINDLHPKTHETTGNKPEKPEMTNKHNTNPYYHTTPADRYKNAQPLMVPFYAE